MSHYLYAETAFHHEGDEGYLKELITAVAETGVKGIKFQVLLNVDEFVSSRHQAYASICQWTFTLDQWRHFFRLALDKGLEIVMMPLDAESFCLAREFPVAYLDLHSVSFYDPAVLKKLKTSSQPIILGAGGRTLEEIDAKINYFNEKQLILMTGFQAFPSDLKDVRLSRIAYLMERYPGLSIGYADHTAYNDPYAILSLEYSFLLGARLFEKHVTLHEGKKRVDCEAAVGVGKLGDIVKRLDYLQSLTSPGGADALEMSPAELRYRQRQKFAVTRHALEAGHILESGDLYLKITDEGIGYASTEPLLGRRLNRRLQHDEIITKDAVT